MADEQGSGASKPSAPSAPSTPSAPVPAAPIAPSAPTASKGSAPATAAGSKGSAPAQGGLLGVGPTPKLAVETLWVEYLTAAGDRLPAVENVSFTVADKPGAGEIVVFLGPSGCGKSTLLKCVAGLMRPTKGRVLVEGQEVQGTSRDRGFVFQAYTSFAWLTVQDNVEYGLRLAGVPKAERATKAMEALKQVGLADYAKRYPKELSGGMKQRVAIARSLVNQPRLLLMDEPFGALDPQTRWGMQSLMLDISRKLDNTIIFVTHDVSEAVYLADTIYVLSTRPAKILHRLDVPYFAERNLSLKQSREFSEVENHVLQLLHGQGGNFRISS
ncbi:ABC transporter ATP-binding protein [Myxococcota bacterium]|nr:ABC transporter ATP-binding protein [Myxococcota bacterium]